MKYMKEILGTPVEIFSIKTKYEESYFISIDKEDAQYIGKSINQAESNAEKLVVEHLKKIHVTN